MEGPGKIIILGVLGIIALGALASGSSSRPTPVVAGESTEDASVVENTRTTNAGSYREQSRSVTAEAELATRPVGPPIVRTVSPHDVTHRSARLRGTITVQGATSGISFFVVAEGVRALESELQNYTTFADLNEQADRVRVVRVDTAVDEDAEYATAVYGLAGDLEYVYRLCFEYVVDNSQARLLCGATESFRTDDATRNRSSLREPSVQTGRVLEVGDYFATVTGEVRMNDYREGIVFFVYGQSEEFVEEVEDRYESYQAVPARGDTLARVRVDSLLNTARTYERTLDDLDRSSEYFYRLCVEYDGSREGLACGSVRSFETRTFDRSRTPEITVASVSQTAPGSAVLGGTVVMNDYFDGLAFLVYGTDAERITSVSSRYDEYLQIGQSGDRLQRLQLDTDLDNRDTFRETVTGLLSRTEYYYTVCVEFEVYDSRDYEREIPTILCGDSRSFTTW